MMLDSRLVEVSSEPPLAAATGTVDAATEMWSAAPRGLTEWKPLAWIADDAAE
jgi:hypothetical protein